jgi:hypothetical protein
MSRILFTILQALLLSCTILEDTDVTSLDELRKLKLKSIQITETINGAAILQTAFVTEEDINETLPNGAILTKRKTIAWPAFTNAIFQFRSGVTSDITLVAEYLTSGRIKFWRVKSGGTEYETYEFQYDGSGFLNLLKTTIKNKTTNLIVIDDKDSYVTKDLYFPQIRNPSADPKLNNKASFGGDAITANNPCGFSFVWQYPLECTTATPPVCTWKNKKEYNYCDGNNFYIVTPAGAGGRIQFKVLQTELLEEVYLAESQSGGTCCTDKFYFHPYLFMPGDLRIKIMYAPDWWKEETSFNGNIDQSVRLKFNYE